MTSKEQVPGLYLHIPFCRSKCFYCDFYSVVSPSQVPAWLDAVQKEILLYEGRFHDFDSLYLGGGTPSILDSRELSVLIASLYRHFTFRSGSEITMEANPESLSDYKLKTIGELGVNRISLGIQSLDDRELKYIGRGHSSNQALQALDIIRCCGFSNISVDLIYGLEIQTIQSWRKTLDRVLEFRPEHISCYQMTFEEGTPLWKMRRAGRVRSIGEKMESAFFVWTSRYLEKRGYHHYEISNFARSREFMCRHNRKYWSHVPYLGIGPSAHSFQGRARWWNVKSIREYCKLLNERKAPIEASEVLSEEQIDLEKLGLGFRTSDGVGIHALRSGDSRMDSTLAKLREAGLVEVNRGRIKPTRKGFLVADSLPILFND